MVKINFVPSDYIHNRECNRTNSMYFIIFAVLMGTIAITFAGIKVRQQSIKTELDALNMKTAIAGKQIAQLDKLKAKSKAMMKTMLTTAKLLEPVPKSLVLACLTNNLPMGVSLSEIKLGEKHIKVSVPKPSPEPKKSQYKATKRTAIAKTNEKPATEDLIEIYLEIEGIAPSDLEVADYILQLGNSVLFDNVELVESKENKIDEIRFRDFKLKTMIKNNIQLTKDDIERIKQKHESG